MAGWRSPAVLCGLWDQHAPSNERWTKAVDSNLRSILPFGLRGKSPLAAWTPAGAT